MATRTRSGLLFYLIIALAVVGVLGGALRRLGGIGTETVTDAAGSVLVASSVAPDVRRCGVRQVLEQNRCGDQRVLLVNARKMPFIARNTKLAWEEGKPAVLTMNRARQQRNRDLACPDSFPRRYGGQCDEYPMASTNEGGGGARTEEVPGRENQCQGGSYRRQYPKEGVRFMVVIVYPGDIATGPYVGRDIAQDGGVC
jgi:deoxyribonuclease NucA/NucB